MSAGVEDAKASDNGGVPIVGGLPVVAAASPPPMPSPMGTSALQEIPQQL